MYKYQKVLIAFASFILINIIIFNLLTLSLTNDKTEDINTKSEIISYMQTDYKNKTNSKYIASNNSNNARAGNSTAHSNYTDVVTEVGKNIGDGLKPIASPNNLIQVKENEEKKQITGRNVLTFILITFVITGIFFISVYYKKSQVMRYSNDHYRLLID